MSGGTYRGNEGNSGTDAFAWRQWLASLTENESIRSKFQSGLGKMFLHFFGEKLQRGSIVAAKAYISAVKYVRFGVLGLMGLSGVVSLFVAGMLLLIIGCVTLLPITAQAMSLSLIGVGLLFCAATATVSALAMKERRWLQASGALDVMERVLAGYPQEAAGDTTNAVPHLETELTPRPMPPVSVVEEPPPFPISELSRATEFPAHA